MELIQTIRNEIERLKEEQLTRNSIGVITGSGVFVNAASLLAFLDTLQEQENPKDLRSLINEASETAQRITDRHSFYASLPENLRHKYTEGSWLEILDVISKYGKQEPEVDLEEEIDKTVNECTDGYNFDWDKFARHFYELGKQSGYSEIPKELEKAAEEYAKLDEEGKWKDGGKYKGFIAGAKWDRGQMLKEAVEKTVFQVTRKRTPVIMITLDANEYKDGDKVRIIVLPKED